MATTTQANGTGAQTTFTIGYTYLSEDFVIVTVDSVLQVKVTDYLFSADGLSIVFEAGSIPGVGVSNVVFARDSTNSTPVPLVDFSKGGAITEANLDTATQQAINIAEENKDNFVDGAFVLDAGAWDADNKIIKNLLDGVAATDAATKGQVDAIAGSATDAAASAVAAAASETAAAASETAAGVSETNAAASAALAAEVSSDFYTGGGTANAHTLTEIVTNQKASFNDGDLVRFRATNTNTATVVTVNVNAQGVKSLKGPDGNNIPTGSLSIDRDSSMRYDSGSDTWELLDGLSRMEELISTTTASGQATLPITIPSDVEELRFTISGLRPSADGDDFQLDVSDDNESSYETDYSMAATQRQSAGVVSSGSDGVVLLLNATGGHAHGTGATPREYFNYDIQILNPGDGTVPFSCSWTHNGMGDNGTFVSGSGGGGLNSDTSATRVTHIRFAFSSGNIALGVIKLYGVKTA